MATNFAGGFLSSFGDAWERGHRLKMEDELSRRKQLGGTLAGLAANARPEAQQEIYTRLAQLATTPIHKKLDKNIGDIASLYAPPPGYGQQSPKELQVGGEMRGKVVAAPEAGSESVPITGGGGARGTSQVPTGLTPPPLSMEAAPTGGGMAIGQAMQAPPAKYSPFYSPEELSQMQAEQTRIAQDKAFRQTMDQRRQLVDAAGVKPGTTQYQQIMATGRFTPPPTDTTQTDIEMWANGFERRMGRRPTDEEVTAHQKELQRIPAGTAADRELSDYMAANGLEDTPKNRDAARVALGTRGQDAPLVLTPEAVDMLAEVFSRTGVVPALGIGAGKFRQQIFDRAAEIATGKGKPTSGAGDTIALNKAIFASQQSALTQLQRNRTAVGAFETTALKNLELFQKTAQKVIDSGSPWINTPLRAISARGLGDADVAALNAARNVALTEIARVVNNPNLTGVLTNDAREGISELIGPNATLVQIVAASNILKQDMTNRKAGLDEEIKTLRDEMSGRLTLTPPPGGGGQTATRADVQAYATQYKLTYEQAAKEFADDGVTVQ